MALGVVKLDMVELGRILEGWEIPVERSQPLMDGREAAANVLDVALEMLHVHRIESDDGGVKSNIGLSHAVTEQEWSLAREKMLLHLLKRLEENLNVLFVCFLGPAMA
jgi:hypothetical protein